MQSGVHRTLYDGPVSAGQLRQLKPHAGCHGKGCRKIALCEEKDKEWHIARGKPYCGDCFREKEARRAAKEARMVAKEAAAAAAVEELSAGLITDQSSCEMLRRRPES